MIPFQSSISIVREHNLIRNGEKTSWKQITNHHPLTSARIGIQCLIDSIIQREFLEVRCWTMMATKQIKMIKKGHRILLLLLLIICRSRSTFVLSLRAKKEINDFFDQTQKSLAWWWLAVQLLFDYSQGSCTCFTESFWASQVRVPARTWGKKHVYKKPCLQLMTTKWSSWQTTQIVWPFWGSWWETVHFV